MQHDHVDRILAQWQQQRPDLDCSPVGVIGRLGRANQIIAKQLQKVFLAHQLCAIEFDILATLRRHNKSLTPTELYQMLMLSSGAMSTRIEHLVKRGVIERIACNEDRRSCKVTLTDAGKKLIDTVMEQHVENEHKILHHLSDDEQVQLADLLRRLLLSIESKPD